MTGPEALLIVDLQVGAFDGIRDVPLVGGEVLLERVGALLAAARAAELPVVFVQDCGRVGGAYEEGTPHWPIHPAIAPRPGEHVVRKRHADAFEETDLAELLRSLGVARVAACGQRSEGCLMATCLGAFAAGLGVVLVEDAHGTTAADASAVIVRANETLHGRGATLETAQALIARWQRQG
jgi:nicotinamidase-related amidase